MQKGIPTRGALFFSCQGLCAFKRLQAVTVSEVDVDRDAGVHVCLVSVGS